MNFVIFDEAYRYAVSIREAAGTGKPLPPKRAAYDTAAMSLLLDQARKLSVTNVTRSRELLSLASWCASTKSLRAIHQRACEEPALALKCGSCNSDQDAYATTCYECHGEDDEGKKTCDACPTCFDACSTCGGCPACSSVEWVRPRPDEVLRSGRWEKAKNPP